jgi:hypothetical protein
VKARSKPRNGSAKDSIRVAAGRPSADAVAGAGADADADADGVGADDSSGAGNSDGDGEGDGDGDAIRRARLTKSLGQRGRQDP